MLFTEWKRSISTNWGRLKNRGRRYQKAETEIYSLQSTRKRNFYAGETGENTGKENQQKKAIRDDDNELTGQLTL
jgi:hypothetical protein